MFLYDIADKAPPPFRFTCLEHLLFCIIPLQLYLIHNTSVFILLLEFFNPGLELRLKFIPVLA